MGIVNRRNDRPYICIMIDEIDKIFIENLKNTLNLLDNFHEYNFYSYSLNFKVRPLWELFLSILLTGLRRKRLGNFNRFIIKIE